MYAYDASKACLTDPVCTNILIYILQRPSSKELLKFPFIRKSKKNSFLIDLIEKFKRYKAAGGGKSDSDSDASDS